MPLDTLTDYYLKKENEKEAIKFAVKASEHENYEAIFILGNYYRKRREIQNAEKWLKLAADNGHIRAKMLFNKYDYYFLGDGTDETPSILAGAFGILGSIGRFLFDNPEE